MAELIDMSRIDLDRYLRDGPAITKVRPAKDFKDRLRARFRAETEKRWQGLPFAKTLDCVRLRAGDMSMWSGINGDGKSGLLNQVMLGLLAKRARVCIASMEMVPDETLKRMAMQASAKVFPEEPFLDAFSDWTDERLWIFDHLGTVPWRYVVALLRYLHAELRMEHVVVDSLTKCGIAPDDYASQKAFAEAIFDHAKATGMHVHLVSHMRKNEKYSRRPSKFDVRGAGELTDIPDNLFMVVRNREKEEKPDDPKLSKEPDTFLIVEKQRNYSWEKTIPLWFKPPIYRWIEHGVSDCLPMDLGIAEPELAEF